LGGIRISKIKKRETQILNGEGGGDAIFLMWGGVGDRIWKKLRLFLNRGGGRGWKVDLTSAGKKG